ncbi:MAG: 50S ribosomal protein L25 [Planctomycetia bacterium]
MSDTLDVSLRKDIGSRASRRLRREGRVPAILYGHGEKSVGLSTNRDAVLAMIRHGSRFVELTGAVTTAAVVRELQWDTFGIEPVHVDFLRVSKTDRVKVKVPIDMKGECPGQRAGGVLNLVMHELEIECTADTIPDHIHALVGQLEIGHSIKVHDLQLPPGARAVTAGEETVVTCLMPAKKGEEAAPAAVEPEVIGRKPAEEGEAEAEKS